MARTKLTPATEERIVKYIRGGAFDWVAARACGIDTATFWRWMQAGEREGRGRPGLYANFRKKVLEARATVRAEVELEVRTTNPLAWLRFGPGRDRPNEPGWTEGPSVTVQTGPVEVRVLYVDIDGRDPEIAAAAPEAENGNRRVEAVERPRLRPAIRENDTRNQQTD